MKATKQEVTAFLKEFGTRVNDTPDNDAELWMDDHICIKYGRSEWYVKEDNMFYTEWQNDLVDYLKEKYHV